MDDGGITLTGLTIGGAALTTIGGLAGAYLKARYSRARIEPQPLEVRMADKFVSCDECASHRCEITRKIEAAPAALEALKRELRETDRKAEERAEALHRRLDKPLEAIAATQQSLKNHLDDHRAGKA